MSSLDENYSELIKDIKNDTLMGGNKTPQTLSDAFHVSSNYLTGPSASAASSGDVRAAYYTADQRAAYAMKHKSKPTPTSRTHGEESRATTC